MPPPPPQSPPLAEWYEEQKTKGLFDLKLFVSPDPDVSTTERSAEVLEMLQAWERGDYEILKRTVS